MQQVAKTRLAAECPCTPPEQVQFTIPKSKEFLQRFHTVTFFQFDFELVLLAISGCALFSNVHVFFMRVEPFVFFGLLL